MEFTLLKPRTSDKAKAEMLSQGVMPAGDVFIAAEGIRSLDVPWSRVVLGKVVPRVVVLSLIAMCWLGGYPTAAVVYSGVMIVKELRIVDRLRGGSNG